MKPTARLAVALGLLLALCLPARAACPPQAQPLDDEAVSAGMRDARDRGFLWRIEKDGRRSWLYGTLHVAERGWMFPGPTLVQALRQSLTRWRWSWT